MPSGLRCANRAGGDCDELTAELLSIGGGDLAFAREQVARDDDSAVHGSPRCQHGL